MFFPVVVAVLYAHVRFRKSAFSEKACHSLSYVQIIAQVKSFRLTQMRKLA
jgi:hypothetical protein